MTVSTKDGLTRQTNVWIDRDGNESLGTWEYQQGTDLTDMANWRLLSLQNTAKESAQEGKHGTIG